MRQIKAKAKKLTLVQATNQVTKPLKRQGDLVLIQNGTTSTFMPGLNSGVRDFDLDSTIDFLEKLYASGGHISSLEKLSDEALALAFEHKAGIISNGIAGSVGDSSDFVRDVREQLATQQVTAHQAAQSIRKTVLDLHQKYKLKASTFAGRKEGAKGEDARLLIGLMNQHPLDKNNQIASTASKQYPERFKDMNHLTLMSKISRLRTEIDS